MRPTIPDGAPRFVELSHGQGAGWLGPALNPFTIDDDPSRPDYRVGEFRLPDGVGPDRFDDRFRLRAELDAMRQRWEHDAQAFALDAHYDRAYDLLTARRAIEAFDLTREDDHTRERYGRNSWGQQLVLARRLVEAGVDVVTTSLSGPLCGRVQNWDDHAVNHHVFDAMRFRSAAYDQAVATLIEDIYERGLAQRVLVVVTGEFGRTPKINYAASTGAGNASAPAGTMQPGRDHWPRAFSNIWAGGGIQTGRVIGATDKRGEDSIERICGPGDFLATIYHHLGIDAAKTMIRDFNGRPTPIVDHGKPIPELMG
jgi:uncharacterized protein (DUF1501 family)